MGTPSAATRRPVQKKNIMGHPFAVRLSLLALLFAALMSSGAQTPRIKGQIDQGSSVAVSGSVSPRALLAHDEGLVAPEAKLSNLSLRFSLTGAQQQELDSLLADQQSPRSPRFHQWLTPEQFHARFGLSDADLTDISAWLSANGFGAIRRSRSGLYLRFAGTAGQVQSAFGVALHQVTAHGERHFTNREPVRLPPQLAAITLSLTGLNDFQFMPRHVAGIVAVGAHILNAAHHPSFTTDDGSHYLSPDDFHTIYDENALISAGTTGAGVTVAVVGQSDIDLADIAAFRSAAGLSPNPPSVILYGSDPGVGSPGDFLESELDVEWAGATAPSATILYVNSTSVVDGSLTEAIDKNLAPIISLSYGNCEANLGAASLAYYSVLLQQAAAQGITVVAPGGDGGATDCDGNAASATQGYAVDFPASSSLVTGVGGTSFNEAGNLFFTAANGANGGSALSYIPEVVWNDDALGGIAAGGGGRSLYFAKPAWQAGTGVPNDFSRDVPDVSVNASPNHDPYLICTSGHCTNGFLNAAGTVEFVGGTSIGPPTVAGMFALVVQKTGTRIGNANPVLYALGESSFAPLVFHDITAGSNASPCTAGSVDCAVGTPIGFQATAGYDLASGLGSIDAFQLVSNWSSVTPLQTSTGPAPTLTDVAGDASSVRAGTPINFTVTVKSASGASSAVPTGAVQFTVNSVPVGTAVPLTSGTSSFTLDTTGLLVGKQTVQATYLGDATFSGSKAAFPVSITAANVPDFNLLPTNPTVTVKAGEVGSGVTLSVTSLNGFSGKVQLTASGPADLSAEYSFSTNPVDLTTAASGTSTLILFAYKGAPQLRQTGKQSASLTSDKPRTPFEFPVMLGGICCFAMLRRKRLKSLAALVVLLGTFGLTGCTSDNTLPPSSNTPAKPGTYSILVTASSAANSTPIVHTTTVTFVVQ